MVAKGEKLWKYYAMLRLQPVSFYECEKKMLFAYFAIISISMKRKSVLNHLKKQGRRTSLGSGGLCPGTFSDLLIGLFFQIAQKCNEYVHQKVVPPLDPALFLRLSRPCEKIIPKD